MKKKEPTHPVLIRFPPAVWEALAGEARKESRSANAQLVHLLRERYGIPADKSEQPAPKKGK